jgi:hypothetical protein
MSNIKREFKDLAIYDPYEYLNSEITGDYDQAHANIHVEQCLLADQYKAVTPLVGYYQFMDKFFTPHYLLDIIAAREQD